MRVYRLGLCITSAFLYFSTLTPPRAHAGDSDDTFLSFARFRQYYKWLSLTRPARRSLPGLSNSAARRVPRDSVFWYALTPNKGVQRRLYTIRPVSRTVAVRIRRSWSLSSASRPNREQGVHLTTKLLVRITASSP